MVSTIPYNKNLPISKIFMPLGYATYNPIVPVNMAFYVGLVASLLESSGVTGTAVPLLVYSGIKLVSSIAFLVWAVIGYRFLPDHPIAEAGAQASEQKSEGEKLSRWKEIVVYIAFVVNFVAMIFLDKLGGAGLCHPRRHCRRTVRFGHPQFQGSAQQYCLSADSYDGRRHRRGRRPGELRLHRHGG